MTLEALTSYWLKEGGKKRGRTRLQRFPKRDTWLAKEIFKLTKVLRKARQVRSRIQQLTATCRDARRS